jgi:hypothetical protein
VIQVPEHACATSRGDRDDDDDDDNDDDDEDSLR